MTDTPTKPRERTDSIDWSKPENLKLFEKEDLQQFLKEESPTEIIEEIKDPIEAVAKVAPIKVKYETAHQLAEGSQQAFYEKLLANNREWVQEKLNIDPDFFLKQAEGQRPPIFFIGCSDSRVPADVIIGALPGEIFVHRNIANMVVNTDLNMLSVLDFAVNALKVSHIIVCGHYGCGGVQAAMHGRSIGIIDNWIRVIKDVYRYHKTELDGIKDEKERWNRFVERNVQEQVLDLAKTTIVQQAWHKNQVLHLHGWVYNINTGIIQDQNVNFENNESLEERYRMTTEHYEH